MIGHQTAPCCSYVRGLEQLGEAAQVPKRWRAEINKQLFGAKQNFET